MLNGLDLFSGIGGITRGLQEYVRPIAYCENERYAQGVLLSRMASGDLPFAPVWNDIRTFQGREFKGLVDIIYGGFPCQDIRVAGKQTGLGGERSGLFWEIMRLAEEIEPAFIFLENVPNIRTKGLAEVGRALADAGYDCRWCAVFAEEVGAWHLRKRWFCLAHARCTSARTEEGVEQERKCEQSQSGNFCCEVSGRRDVPDSDSLRKLQSERGERIERRRVSDSLRWSSEPSVGRVANGVSARMDRIKCLGNAVVPQQVTKAFEYLLFGD